MEVTRVTKHPDLPRGACSIVPNTGRFLSERCRAWFLACLVESLLAGMQQRFTHDAMHPRRYEQLL